MSELDGILPDTAGSEWVDVALARTQWPSYADVAEMDLTAGFDAVLGQIWDIDRASKPVRTRSRGRRAAVSLAVVGGLLGTGGLAASAAGVSYRSIGGALTGQFGQSGKTENDTSEIVDLTASDFPTVARQLTQQLQQDGLRFAPGYDVQRNVDATIKRLQQLGGQTDVTGVKGWIADDAACTWERGWLTANQQHDQTGMSAASAGLDQTARLTIMSQINNATSLAALAEDAEQGNAAPIQTDVTLNCPDSLT